MKLVNKTKLSNEDIRLIINLVRPSGISKFKIEFYNTSNHWFKGRMYHSYHETLVKIGIPKGLRIYPRMINEYFDQHTLVLSHIEELVHTIAHELMHVKQSQVKNYRRTFNSKGAYSEKDTTAYSRKMLRKYRRLANTPIYDTNLLYRQG